MTARRAVEVVVWWALAYAVWLLSLSTVPLQELAVAALCALPCGVAAAGARWAIGESWAVKPRWLRPMLVLPFAIVSDAIQVLFSALRLQPSEGRFQRVPSSATGSDAHARGRRALATGLVTASPGSYVLDVDPDSGEMLIHSLASRGPRIERRVAEVD